jgi:hypothetical protein
MRTAGTRTRSTGTARQPPRQKRESSQASQGTTAAHPRRAPTTLPQRFGCRPSAHTSPTRAVRVRHGPRPCCPCAQREASRSRPTPGLRWPRFTGFRRGRPASPSPSTQSPDRRCCFGRPPPRSSSRRAPRAYRRRGGRFVNPEVCLGDEDPQIRRGQRRRREWSLSIARERASIGSGVLRSVASRRQRVRSQLDRRVFLRGRGQRASVLR